MFRLNYSMDRRFSPFAEKKASRAGCARQRLPAVQRDRALRERPVSLRHRRLLEEPTCPPPPAFRPQLPQDLLLHLESPRHYVSASPKGQSNDPARQTPAAHAVPRREL